MNEFKKQIVTGFCLGMGFLIACNFCRMLYDMGYTQGYSTTIKRWSKPKGNVIIFPVDPARKPEQETDESHD